MAKVPGDILDRVQNHITREKQGVGHVNNRYSYDREKQQALETWERKLISILTGKQGNVVPFGCEPADS